jgi:dUTP pyrophosphatase
VSPSPVVYLAHPIDFADEDYASRVCYVMQNEGLTAYIPGYAFKTPLGAMPNERLSRINRAALSECDGLIAVLPLGQKTLGVPMEIEQARAEGKPTLIVADSDTIARSWALPRTKLTLFTDELSENSVRSLHELIARNNRLRHRKPASQAMYVRMDPGAALPTRAYEGDAGFDMYTTEEVTIPAGGFVDVPVGIAVQFPDRIWGLIVGRSSTVRRLDLLVTPGVIDTGYRGPLYAGVRSLREDDYVVKKGERLAQIIPFPNVAMGLHATPVDVLAPSDRGEAGFGSSGA